MAPAWRRVVRPAVMVVAVVLVFGWLLPQFIDYDDVQEALTQLNTTEVVILLALALARVPTEALMYRAFLPGLRLWRGSEAYLSSNFAGQILPPPGASLVQFAYFRRNGYPVDTAGLAAAGTFLFPTLGRFLLPVVAVLVLLVSGEIDGTVLLAGGVALLISAGAAVAGYVLLRSERSAYWLGARLQGPINGVRSLFKRESIGQLAEKAATLRNRTLILLIQGWKLGTLGVAANLLLTFSILLASLRFVGVDSAELSSPNAFAAFAIAFWAGAVFPVTGSGLGVVDAVLVAMLFELSGASDDALVAAALLWRVFYSLVTLPLGAVTWSRFRGAG